MRILARKVDDLELPAVEKIARPETERRARAQHAGRARAVRGSPQLDNRRKENPVHVLIATMLSAQTRDPVTAAAAGRLFRAAPTAAGMSKLPISRIQKLIYPVSFYRHKARHVKATCRRLVARYRGRVPATMEELLALPGVGRKTANLVLILGHSSRENICVDTHVHRIANRLGWVRTKTPEQTERGLYTRAHPRWWPSLNRYLVTWGQNVCRPLYPLCGSCALGALCPRIGVVRVGRTRRA